MRLHKGHPEGGGGAGQLPLQPAPGLLGIGGLTHQPEAVVTGGHQLLCLGVLTLGEEDIDAAEKELFFAGEGVDRAEHTGPLAADQGAQLKLSFDAVSDSDVGGRVAASQALHIGEGVFFGGLAHRQGHLCEGAELIAMPVVQELMQQQGPLGTLAPVGQRCVFRKAEAPAAVKQLLQLVLQPFVADGVIEHICCQPEAGQLGVLGRAVAAQLLLKQRLELTEAAATCLLQG